MAIFRVTHDDGVAVITMDLPGEPVNKLSAAGKAEFTEVFAALAEDSTVKAMVFLSGKPDTFIAGADIEEFTKVTSREEAEALSRGGQAMLDDIANLAKPVVRRQDPIGTPGGPARTVARGRRLPAAPSPDRTPGGPRHDSDRQIRPRPEGLSPGIG